MEPPNLYPVKLYVYDLSKGLARRLSPIMLGEGGCGERAGTGQRGLRDGRPRGPGLGHDSREGPEDAETPEERRCASEVGAP